MKAERLVWVDSLKGWLIVLVVLGHALQCTLGVNCAENHLWNFIYSFHMPAFMAVSGYLAYRSCALGGGKLFATIFRRFRQLVIPFFIWSLISLLIHNNLSIETIEAVFVHPDSGLWFLWVLFIITIIFLFGCWISDICKVKQEVIIFILCAILTGIMVVFDTRVFGYQFIAYYFLFYTLGYYLHKYDIIITRRKFLMVVLFVVWAFLAWFWKMHEAPSFVQFLPLPGAVVQYGYRFITAAIAVYLLFAASPLLLNSDKLLNAPFKNLGCYSLGIYAVHFMFIGDLVEVISKASENQIVVICLSFVVGLLLSWLIVWFLSKWKITAMWLLGKI